MKTFLYSSIFVGANSFAGVQDPAIMQRCESSLDSDQYHTYIQIWEGLTGKVGENVDPTVICSDLAAHAGDVKIVTIGTKQRAIPGTFQSEEFQTIADLTPLTDFSSIKKLTIGETTVAGVSDQVAVVGDLPHLSDLTIHSLVSPIPYLSGTRLESLTISGITQFDGLESLTSLKSLIVTYHAATGDQPIDLIPISGSTSLEKLDLSLQRVDDYAPLEKMTRLKTLNLYAMQPALRDLSFLEPLSQLEQLDINNNKAHDIKVLENLCNLRELKARGNYIVELNGIENLENLETAAFGGNLIKSIDGLSSGKGLRRLETLDLQRNLLLYVRGVHGLSALRELYLGSNVLIHVEQIGSLTGLERLDVSGNQLIDLSGIKALASLKTVDISRNRIKSLAGLENSRELLDLRVFDNPIADLTTLAGLSKLVEFHIQRTLVTDLRPIGGLYDLETLGISKKSVIDWSPGLDLAPVNHLTAPHLNSQGKIISLRVTVI